MATLSRTKEPLYGYRIVEFAMIHSSTFRVRVVAALVFLWATTASAQYDVLENGKLNEWSNGVPDGWTVGIGANRPGEGPESKLQPLPDSRGLTLIAEADTCRWKMLSTSVDLAPNAVYDLRFEARALDRRPEAGFSSCYVGLWYFNEADQRIGNAIRTVTLEDWRTESMLCFPPETAVRGEVTIFLAHPGRLEVRNVGLDELYEEDSFEILIRDLDRNYSYFAHRDLDWPKLAKRFRRRADQAKNVGEFVDTVKAMLHEFQDEHIWIDADGQGRVVPFVKTVDSNFELATLQKELVNLQWIDRIALTAETKDGWAYVGIFTLQGIEHRLDDLKTAIIERMDAPGLVLDLRVNRGGAEAIAQQIASLFCAEPTPYAKASVRSGPAYDDLSVAQMRSIPAAQGPRFDRPVACLIGPHCGSSGECFAMMMRALPQARLFGQPSRGSSGNPHPIVLPNGVTVWYSRWVNMLPDGAPIEGVGVPPDKIVAPRAQDDRTLREAIDWLSNQREDEGR